MKKLIAMLLVAVMALSLFAACNKNPDPTDPPATDAKPTNAPTEAVTEATKAPAEDSSDDAAVDTSWILEADTNMEGTVNFWVPFKENQGMGAMIAEFNETYPNITINLNPYNNNADGNVAVNTAIVGGQVDVLASFNLANTYNRWANGLFIDITDKCTEEGIDLVEQWGTDAYTYEGAIYTFPCGGRSHYIAINMTMWEEAGLGELPTEWTWDEYLAACEALTKVGDNGLVEVYGGTDYHNFDYVANAYASVVGKDAYYDEDGTSSFDNDYVVNALKRELQAELVDKIWYPRATYSGDNTQTQDIYTAKLAATAITNNMVRFLHDANYNVDFITGFAPYPVEEKGQTNYLSGVCPFSHAGITTNCQDEDAAWAFLKWYSTYGVKYLAAAGHQPNWKGTEPGSAIEVIYGSVEEAAKWIDVESFTNLVGRADLPGYIETNLTAYTDVSNALKEYVLLACGGQMTAEEAMQAACQEADKAIEAAKK